MQTFLPYPDFQRSAATLDSKRLNKQILECAQILRALTDPEAKGWKNHPVTRMWKGHRLSLAEYATVFEEERKARLLQAGRTYVRHKSLEAMEPLVASVTDGAQETGVPKWFGMEELHSAHRANLLRKDPVFYGAFGWTELPAEGYPYDEALALMCRDDLL